MPKLVEAGFEGDLKDQVARSGVHLSFGDKQLKLRLINPLKPLNPLTVKEVAARWSGNHWSFGYDFSTKDVDFEYRTQIKPGELQIRQRIPRAQWELFPTPEFRLSANPRQFGKLEHKLAVSYDLLMSRGRLEQTFDYNKRLKLKANADSAMGGHFGLITNIDKPWAKSVGVEHSKKIGTLLTYHAEPSKRLLFETALGLRRHELWTSVQIAPTKDSKIKFTAEATVNNSTKPALRLGARYTV